MAKPKLTVCLLAKNEENNIGRALTSIQSAADEIIVVDTGSTDRTIEIAESFGAKIVHHPWNESFADARNAGLEHATGDWVLMLDADEAVSEKMARMLQGALRDLSAEGYLTILTNYVEGKPLDRGAVLRLFRNRRTYRYSGRVHESIMESLGPNQGKVKTLHAIIEHYGYNPVEDKRKGRRERNKRLLESMLEEEPTRASTWFFLGLEHTQLSDHGRAMGCFRKALALNPTDLRSVLGAHLLAGIHHLRQRVEDSWDLAHMGSGHEVTRWDSLMRTAQVALVEGDFLTASDSLDQLNKANPEDFGKVPREPATLLDMSAKALWQQGRQSEAVRQWERGVSTYPGDHALATQWVRHRVLAEGLRSGTLGALQMFKTSPVASAVAGAMLRAHEYDLAANLSRNTLERGHLSSYTLYGMVRAGQVQKAEEVALNQGLEGAIYLATAGAWFDRPKALNRALEELSGSWRAAFEGVLAEELVAPADQWALDMLMVMWADAGCLKLLDAAARSLSPEPGLGVARVAWLLYQAQQQQAALERALRVPDQPDAQEVLGLISAERSDWETTAQFLVQRGFAGPAPVRVYYQAAQALVGMGRKAEAREIMQLGASHRRHSILLKRGLPS